MFAFIAQNKLLLYATIIGGTENDCLATCPVYEEVGTSGTII